MGTAANRELIEELKGITVLELSERIKALEEEFGISAAAVAAASPSVSARTEGAERRASLRSLHDDLVQVLLARLREGDRFDAAGVEFAQSLRDRFANKWPAAGLDIKRASDAASAQALWSERVGELVSPAQYGSAAGISRQAVQQQIAKRRLIAARRSDGCWLLPLWQVQLEPSQRAVLATAVESFVSTGRASAFSALAWLVEPHPDLRGLAPRAAVKVEECVDLIGPAAQRDAVAGTQ